MKTKACNLLFAGLCQGGVQVRCVYVCVQWALHHICDGSPGVSDLLPWLDCCLPVAGCHPYLLQGQHQPAGSHLMHILYVLFQPLKSPPEHGSLLTPDADLPCTVAYLLTCLHRLEVLGLLCVILQVIGDVLL